MKPQDKAASKKSWQHVPMVGRRVSECPFCHRSFIVHCGHEKADPEACGNYTQYKRRDKAPQAGT